MTFSTGNTVRSLLLVLGIFVAGCGSAEIGEDCDTAGATEECVDGAICTNDDTNVCRLVCDVQEDCPTNYTCNGVSGSSTKSCQPDAI